MKKTGETGMLNVELQEACLSFSVHPFFSILFILSIHAEFFRAALSMEQVLI